MKSHFRMFAAYNAWANGVIYSAAARLADEDYRLDRGAAFKSVHGTLNHILVADRIWMKRFTGDGDAPAKLDIILYDDRALLRIAREAEDARIMAWIDDLLPEAFTGRFTYTTVTDLRTISQRLGAFLQPPDPPSRPSLDDPDRLRRRSAGDGFDLFSEDRGRAAVCLRD